MASVNSSSPAAPTGSPSPASPTPAQWLRVNAARSGHWPRVAILAGALSTLLLLVQAWAIATIAQRMVIDEADFSTLLVPLLVLPCAFIARGLCARLKTLASTRAGILVRQSIRAELLQRLGERGPLWARRQHSATLGNRIWDQVDALHGYYADYRPQMMLCALIPLIILVAVFPLNWAAGLILLITGPMIPLNMAMIGWGAKSLQEAQFREMNRLGRHFLDTVRGLPTLKLFGIGRAQAASVERVSEDFRRRTMKVLRLAFLSSTALEFFASVSIALLAIYIGFSYLGHFSFGTWDHGLSLFIGLFILVLAPEYYQPLRDLGTHYHAKAEAEAAAEDLIPLLARDAADGESPPARGWRPPERLGLRLHQVVARYPGQLRPALDGLDLELRPGETLAVIGPSGAGKTTLLNVLLGFLPIESGSLASDAGEPLADLAREEWQRSLGWVGQRPALIKGSLADNLRLAANGEVDDAALWKALEQAQLKPWARALPRGLDTAIGEGGQPVSGGQARRIALARAFLRDAPLTLLDEPTASLDVESEELVIDALDRLRRGRTLVMLTHRLELLRLADRILILDNGRATACADFATLSAPGGPLAYLAQPRGLQHV